LSLPSPAATVLATLPYTTLFRSLPGLRLRGRADLVGAARARGGGRAADRGRRALRPVHRRSRRRCRRDAVTGGTRVGPARARRQIGRASCREGVDSSVGGGTLRE